MILMSNLGSNTSILTVASFCTISGPPKHPAKRRSDLNNQLSKYLQSFSHLKISLARIHRLKVDANYDIKNEMMYLNQNIKIDQ
jgi:hypothetical protein